MKNILFILFLFLVSCNVEPILEDCELNHYGSVEIHNNLGISIGVVMSSDSTGEVYDSLWIAEYDKALFDSLPSGKIKRWVYSEEHLNDPRWSTFYLEDCDYQPQSFGNDPW